MSVSSIPDGTRFDVVAQENNVWMKTRWEKRTHYNEDKDRDEAVFLVIQERDLELAEIAKLEDELQAMDDCMNRIKETASLELIDGLLFYTACYKEHHLGAQADTLNEIKRLFADIAVDFHVDKLRFMFRELAFEVWNDATDTQHEQIIEKLKSVVELA
ncbi:MAG: hypothetical protein AAFR67_10595 [Chloroflexota bacterium]